MILLLFLALPPGLCAQNISALNPEIRAQIVPVKHTILSAEMDGRINKLPVREGDYFNKQDLLLAFDCALERALLDKARAKLNRAEKKMAVEKRLMQLDSGSELELAVAEAKVREARAEKSVQEVKAGRCAIKAPFAGRVAELMVQRFQTVKEGQSLMRIVNPDILEIKLLVPSTWLSWLKPGHDFKVHVDETNSTYEAEVRATGPWIDAVSQSVQVYARIKGGHRELRPGMSGKASLKALR